MVFRNQPQMFDELKIEIEAQVGVIDGNMCFRLFENKMKHYNLYQKVRGNQFQHII